MSRRNTTHLSRLARAVVAGSDLTYAQALVLCRAASARGALPSRLDPPGMSLAERRLIYAARTGGQLSTWAAPEHPCLGRDVEGATVFTPVARLAAHTLVVGAAGSGKSMSALALGAQWVAGDLPVLVLDLGAAASPSARGDWERDVAVAQGVGFTGATLGVDRVDLDALQGVTRVSASRAGRPSGVDEALWREVFSEVLAWCERRTREPVSGAPRVLVVIENAPWVDRDLLLGVQSRARAAGLALVLMCRSVADWAAGGRDDWGVVHANVGLAIIHTVSDPDAVVLGQLYPGVAGAAMGVAAAQGVSPLTGLEVGQVLVCSGVPDVSVQLVHVRPPL